MTNFQLVIILIILSQKLVISETTKTPRICQEVLIGLSNCCAGTTWDDHQKECVQCDPGFRGINCSELCPRGVFGRRCQSACPQECQYCHHITGGCLTDQNRFVGHNSSFRCPRGVFGRRCQSICPQDCQDCHHITGECLTDQNERIACL
ncbi:multiple epidermal growth factor-like domains protein 10 isoform X2 [Ostrea edulis]|uniref:multiple epidermal growth factor-like domains protein 10 isoform X2 n=1 Tax=Ostrea edulis TaxID=37623 RepID=UPI0024AFF564|nr:multiple epidermal growth factor-like domains protein 10 isoform X2 [Ostrea edulis]